MAERYNVYFAGQVKHGCDLQSVRDKLAKVFNADQATLDKLFSGKPQLIKRDCDQATALKYKEAMERAGAEPILKATAAQGGETGADRALTAANKIAALATAPDEDRYRTPPAHAPSPDNQRDSTGETGGIALAPPGTAVLREEERAAPLTREVDTSQLAVDTTAERLSEQAPPAPAPPDTRHLSMAAVGETIPNLPSSDTPLSPDIEGIELSAAGTDFSDCAAPEAQALPLDLSALSVLPPGTPVDEQYRKRDSVVAPATDHISLKD